MIRHPKIFLLIAIAGSALFALFADRVNPYFLDVALGVGISIILAVSLNLINGHTGQFSLGHAGFMAVGAYSTAVVTTLWGSALSKIVFGQMWALLAIALLVGGIVAAITGLIVGLPSLRLRGDYLAIVTLGFGEIIRVVLQSLDAVGGSRGMSTAPGFDVTFYIFAIAAITVYTVTTLVNSTYGRGFLAVHDDEVAAEAIGINTTRYKVTAFVLGAFFAGVAGGLYAHLKGFITPSGFTFMRSFEIVVMVILGGMGNTAGVIIAAIILTVLPEVLRDFAQYRMVLYSLLLIILMLLRPQGLFTWRGIGVAGKS